MAGIWAGWECHSSWQPRFCKQLAVDMPYAKLLEQLKGGPGSGNFGHSGRKGKRGGSAPKGGGAIAADAVTMTKSPNNWAIAETLGAQNVKGGRGTIKGDKVPKLRQTLEANGWREQKLGPGNTYVRPSQRDADGKRIDFDYRSDTGETWLDVRDYLG